MLFAILAGLGACLGAGLVLVAVYIAYKYFHRFNPGIKSKVNYTQKNDHCGNKCFLDWLHLTLLSNNYSIKLSITQLHLFFLNYYSKTFLSVLKT